jgi:hypothetical protein
MTRVAAVLGAITLVLAGCGDDDEAPAETTDVEVTIGQGLPIGASYEDPTGNVTIAVNGVRLVGDLLLANAEACATEGSLPPLPIMPDAWQLRVRGEEQAIPRVLLENLPDTGARPTAIIFTQLSQPIAWRVRN